MSCRAGFVWATPQHFNRYLEECGIPCELVTPQMLAAPFYRGEFRLPDNSDRFRKSTVFQPAPGPQGVIVPDPAFCGERGQSSRLRCRYR